MHLVEARGQSVLLDCGLTLGHGPEVHERNRHFPFDPTRIDAVLLSHAHVDHCGNLPNLVRQGFRGRIYCTAATRDLIAIMLADSARIQRQESRVGRILGHREEVTREDLYSAAEVDRTLEQCVPLAYQQRLEIGEGISVRFHDAGHLLGSAMTELTFDVPSGRRTLTYTGDLGRSSLDFLRPPARIPASDVVISESTYGGRIHQSIDTLTRTLQAVACRTVARGGKVLVPAFSLGRAQLVVHYLQRWMRQGVLPTVPIYVDSPLAADIAEVHEHYLSDLTEAAQTTMPARVHYVREREESRELSRRSGPCVLVASGGMCEAGRILNHLEHNIDDPRNSVVLVSYQAPGSLGRRLLERGPTVRFRSHVWNKWADVVDLNGFSGHADQGDFLNLFRPLAAHAPAVHLVHGDFEQAHALKGVLSEAGFAAVDIPRRADHALVA
jgi:metallo-beta-lactamase family protein